MFTKSSPIILAVFLTLIYGGNPNLPLTYSCFDSGQGVKFDSAILASEIKRRYINIQISLTPQDTNRQRIESIIQ
jgi:hypothetical protein